MAPDNTSILSYIVAKDSERLVFIDCNVLHCGAYVCPPRKYVIRPAQSATRIIGPTCTKNVANLDICTKIRRRMVIVEKRSSRKIVHAL